MEQKQVGKHDIDCVTCRTDMMRSGRTHVMKAANRPVAVEPAFDPPLVRKLVKGIQKLTERHNRIKNLVPGRRRIWELGDIAMLLMWEAEVLRRDKDMELADEYEAKALYLRRLEYDLTELRDAVRGEHRRMSRTDPRHWRGERP